MIALSSTIVVRLDVNPVDNLTYPYARHSCHTTRGSRRQAGPGCGAARWCSNPNFFQADESPCLNEFYQGMKYSLLLQHPHGSSSWSYLVKHRVLTYRRCHGFASLLLRTHPFSFHQILFEIAVILSNHPTRLDSDAFTNTTHAQIQPNKILILSKL